MQQHSILSPWIVGNREVVPPTRQCVAAYGIICQIFVSISNQFIVTRTRFSTFVPCDFFLFSWLKLALKGHCYADMQAIQTFMTKQLCSVPKSAFHNCFEDSRNAGSNILTHKKLFWRKALAPECKYTTLMFMLPVLELSGHGMYILAMYITDLEKSCTIFYNETPLGTVKIQHCF